MEDDLRAARVVADRINVDIEGLRDRIDSSDTSPYWERLSMAQRLRILLEEALEARAQRQAETKGKPEGKQ